jgi:hypothetical protein
MGSQVLWFFLYSSCLIMFLVFQSYTDNEGNTEITNLYEVRDEDVAADEVDRINSNLQLAGIPSSVSCAYYQ